MSVDAKIVFARVRGRPSLYNPLYCDRVLDLGAKGCSKAEIAAALSVSRKTLNSWIKTFPDFREAMSRAKDLEYAWWLARGREHLTENWNAASWALQMRNRFGKTVAKPSQGRKTSPKQQSERVDDPQKLRDDLERKLSRIADAGAEDEVSGESIGAGA